MLALKKLKITDYKLQIERDDLPAGIYFYEVKQDAILLNSGKLVIE